MRIETIMKQTQAKQIVEFISIAFSRDHSQKPTALWEYYPDLFKKEKHLYEKQQEDNALEELKAGRNRFMNYYNHIGGDNK